MLKENLLQNSILRQFTWLAYKIGEDLQLKESLKHAKISD